VAIDFSPKASKLNSTIGSVDPLPLIVSWSFRRADFIILGNETVALQSRARYPQSSITL
jgi:hypothetical protein